jgi:hypothetical protein
MNLSMPDALVICTSLVAVIVAIIKFVPVSASKQAQSHSPSVCSEHSGIAATIIAMNKTLERLQDTMQQVQALLVTLAQERGHESGRTSGAA